MKGMRALNRERAVEGYANTIHFLKYTQLIIVYILKGALSKLRVTELCQDFLPLFLLLDNNGRSVRGRCLLDDS